ncbi:MAG: hypothetical protein J4428_04300 [Candidatus Aenigmarchaeota archaeon]|nr:hypothetical protein [Candidatus Aenigmarchaeota archaeon]
MSYSQIQRVRDPQTVRTGNYILMIGAIVAVLSGLIVTKVSPMIQNELQKLDRAYIYRPEPINTSYFLEGYK